MRAAGETNAISWLRQRARPNVSVFKTFPDTVFHVLCCVLQTTLGPEIVAAAIPHSCMVILFARHLVTAMRVLACSSLPLGILIIFLAGAEDQGNPLKIIAVRIGAALGTAYALCLIIFVVGIYAPMRSIILPKSPEPGFRPLPLALVFSGGVSPCGSTGDSTIDFVEVTVGQCIGDSALDINRIVTQLRGHIFAMLLQGPFPVKVMIYQERWVKVNMRMSLLLCVVELSVCLWFLWVWCFTDITAPPALPESFGISTMGAAHLIFGVFAFVFGLPLVCLGPIIEQELFSEIWNYLFCNCQAKRASTWRERVCRMVLNGESQPVAEDLSMPVTGRAGSRFPILIEA